MLIRRNGEGAFAITQPAHAWISGVLARAWGNAAFAQPRQEVCLAAALHDIGWLDWEMRPEFDPRTGLPRVFADVPAEIHTELWRRGVEQLRAYGLYAAVLVSMHGETIYDKTFDPETARPEAAAAVRRFRQDQASFQARAISILRDDPAVQQDPARRAAISDEAFAVAKRFLAAVDTLSLHLCWGAGKAIIDDVPVSDGIETALTLTAQGVDHYILEPWPFRDNILEVGIEGRSLPHPFASESDHAEGLAAAEPTVLAVTLHPREWRRS